MKSFRTVSRVAVAAMVVICASNIVASESIFSKVKTQSVSGTKNGIMFGYDNKFALAGSKYANDKYGKNNYFEKAGLATLGHAFDRIAKGGTGNLDLGELTGHFGSHMGVGYASQKLNENGITLDAAGKICKSTIKKCDFLPEEGMMRNVANFTADNVVKPVAKTAAETVTNPEIITLYALQYVVLPMLKYLQGTE